MLGPGFWRIYLRCYDVLTVLHPYRQMLADVQAAARITDGMCVLDAGCGTGNLVRHVQEQGIACRMVGVDFSPDMLACARQKCGAQGECEFLLLNLNEPLPFPPASFDCVIGCNVLYAIADAPLLLRRLADVLKPGGCMVQTIPRYGYNMFRILRQHLHEDGWPERRQLLRHLSALFMLLGCNLLICLVYSAAHPILKQVGRRRLQHRQTEELAAYLQVYGCSMTMSHTYAGQNWLLSYTKIEDQR